jgi:uncharacterized protein HemX
MLLNQIQHTKEMPNAAGTAKMEVVVAVISVLFIGIAVFMFLLERRLKKLENKKQEQVKT